MGFTTATITTLTVRGTSGNELATYFGNNEYVVNITLKEIEMGTPEITKIEFNKKNQVINQYEWAEIKI